MSERKCGHVVDHHCSEGMDWIISPHYIILM